MLLHITHNRYLFFAAISTAFLCIENNVSKKRKKTINATTRAKITRKKKRKCLSPGLYRKLPVHDTHQRGWRYCIPSLKSFSFSFFTIKWQRYTHCVKKRLYRYTIYLNRRRLHLAICFFLYIRLLQSFNSAFPFPQCSVNLERHFFPPSCCFLSLSLFFLVATLFSLFNPPHSFVSFSFCFVHFVYGSVRDALYPFSVAPSKWSPSCA